MLSRTACAGCTERDPAVAMLGQPTDFDMTENIHAQSHALMKRGAFIMRYQLFSVGLKTSPSSARIVMPASAACGYSREWRIISSMRRAAFGATSSVPIAAFSRTCALGWSYRGSKAFR